MTTEIFDVVTFAITLPTSAPLEEHVKAIEAAMTAHNIAGNPAAAQALSVIAVLARRGMLAFNDDTAKVPHR